MLAEAMNKIKLSLTTEVTMVYRQHVLLTLMGIIP